MTTMTQVKDETSKGPVGNYTLSEALETAGTGRYQWMIIFLTGTSFAIDAVQVFMMVFLVPILEDVWDLESLLGSMIPVVFLVGVLVASMIWARVADVWGRRKTLIFGMLVTAISATATIFVTNIWSLLICRFFSGLGFIKPVIIILIIEFSPVKDRARSMIVAYFCWTSGGILSIILAWLIIPAMDENTGWRVYVLATCVLTWIVAVASFWCPESALWYCTVGEFDKAEKLIQQVLKTNGKKPMPGRLLHEHDCIEVRGKIKDLFVPNYRKATIILALAYTTDVLVYYGVDFISERLFVDSSLYISVTVTNLSELPAIASGILMNRIGWSWMTLYTKGATTLALLIVAILWDYSTSVSYIWVINVVLVFAARGLSLAASMVIMTYYSVYYPTAIRATALGLAFGLSRFGAMGAMFIAEDMNVIIALIVLASVSIISCLLCFLLTDMTIQEDLSNEVDYSEGRISDSDSVSKRGGKNYEILLK